MGLKIETERWYLEGVLCPLTRSVRGTSGAKHSEELYNKGQSTAVWLLRTMTFSLCRRADIVVLLCAWIIVVHRRRRRPGNGKPVSLTKLTRGGGGRRIIRVFTCIIQRVSLSCRPYRASSIIFCAVVAPPSPEWTVFSRATNPP